MSWLKRADVFAILLVASGCSIKGAEPPLTGADGVTVNNGVASLDEGKVPVISGSCADGQLVARTKSGWECVTPAQPAILKAGNGIDVENNTISAHFGTGHEDVAAGDHNHDGVYRKEGEKVAWSDVDAMPTDVWPGSVPYAQITGAPALDWNMVGATVKQDTPWPGTVDYAHLTNTPAPYTDLQAQAAVTWSTVKGSVKSTDVWPGTMPYSELTGAPAPYTDAQAQAAVKWSTVEPSVATNASWPGTVDYSHVTNAPAPYTDTQARAAVSWSTVGPTVPRGGIDTSLLSSNAVTITPQAPLTGGGTVGLGGTATIGLAPAPAGQVLVSNGNGWNAASLSSVPGQARVTTGALTLYVRTDGDDTLCNGSANATAISAPNCAFASPQQAVNAVPEVVAHPVSIQVAAGTYYASAGALAVLSIQRQLQGTGASLSIRGAGSVTLSGASSASPGTAVAQYGILVNGTSSLPKQPAVTLSGMTVQTTTGVGINVVASAVQLNGVTVQSTGGDGLVCWNGAFCQTTGNVTVTGASAVGVHVYEAGTLLNSGTLSSSSHGSHGFWSEYGSTITSTGTLTASSNLGRGIYVDAGMFVSSGTLSSTNNSGEGIDVEHRGQARLQGSTTLSGNQNTQLRGALGSDVSISGPLSVASGTTYAVLLDGQSSMAFGGSSPVNISCTGSNEYGITAWTQSLVSFTTSGSATISNCWVALWVTQHSELNDNNNGSRTIQGTSTPINIDRLSIYNHGGWPAAPSGYCNTYSHCP